jgi:hypothetical protein
MGRGLFEANELCGSVRIGTLNTTARAKNKALGWYVGIFARFATPWRTALEETQ